MNSVPCTCVFRQFSQCRKENIYEKAWYCLRGDRQLIYVYNYLMNVYSLVVTPDSIATSIAIELEKDHLSRGLCKLWLPLWVTWYFHYHVTMYRLFTTCSYAWTCLKLQEMTASHKTGRRNLRGCYWANNWRIRTSKTRKMIIEFTSTCEDPSSLCLPSPWMT